jgi:F-type H+-transporting ATPase subunit c
VEAGVKTKTKTKTTKTMFTELFAMFSLLAEIDLKSVHVGLAAVGGGIGIGLLGRGAAEATGRNPGAATPILVISIILAALIEGIFILSAFAV